MDLNRAIQVAVRSGKVRMGFRNAARLLKTDSPKLVVISGNCPEDVRREVMYYCKLTDVPFIVYPGSSWDLGALCGRPHIISVLTILDPGDSDILKIIKRG
ncbi:MAG: 50S ribosomal protein L30e [Candidatus Freyarchaeota archaeon]|nr:50S ribosomal protein L30e [Candidatus Jordarchaeia archaeon]